MKKKKIILIILGGVISLVVICGIWRVTQKMGSKPENLISNQGFEILNELNEPKFWTQDSGGKWQINMENIYEGKRCMRTDKNWRFLSQEISVKQRKYYVFRVYVKSHAIIGGEPAPDDLLLTLEYLNKIGEVIKKDWGVCDGFPSWQLKERIIFTPTRTKKIRVKLAKRQGEGNVWFDNIQLIEYPSNLIRNPGFEVGESEIRPKLWSISAEGGWKADTEDPYQGERCMQADEPWSWIWQDFSSGPNEFYILRAYVKSDIDVYKNALLSIECRDGNDKIIKEEHGTVSAVSSWQLRENSIFTPANTEKIRIKLAKRQGEGSVWFDNVELKLMPSYLRIGFLRGILEDKPFFIFYFSLYFTLFILLLMVIFKK